MLKRVAAAALCLCLFFAAGCENPAQTGSEPAVEESRQQASEPAKPVVYINPLTGVSGLSADKASSRPVAIMINNIAVAQSVQCGLAAADLIYETEVEGGITRLMAVYQDVSAVDRIGTIRSARYAYIDLAMGLNAVYCHRGQDDLYAGPHLNDLDDYDINENNAGKRIANGKASEHTLYTFGSTLFEALSSERKLSAGGTVSPIMSFAGEEETVTLGGGACSAVSVEFSGQQTSSFVYDAAGGKFLCKSNGTARKDYITGDSVKVENVFVLLTSITNYADGYHRKVDLTGGDGYYFTNGTYTPIKWSKGSAKSAISLKNPDGTPLTVSAGSSWFCLADKYKSQPQIS